MQSNAVAAASVEIHRLPDTAGDTNRGWREDRLEAYVDGAPAGFLVLEHIPRARFNAWYPRGAWDYLRQVRGMVSLAEVPDPATAEEALGRCGIFLAKANPRHDPMRGLLRRVEKRVVKEWVRFQANHVDRPRVFLMDTLSVGDHLHVFRKRGANPGTDRSEVSFAGLGIDGLLLSEAARWVAEWGLTLTNGGVAVEALGAAAVPAWAGIATVVAEDGTMSDIRAVASRATSVPTPCRD